MKVTDLTAVGAISQSDTEMAQVDNNVQMCVMIHGHAQTCLIPSSAHKDGHVMLHLVLATKMLMAKVMRAM